MTRRLLLALLLGWAAAPRPTRAECRLTEPRFVERDGWILLKDDV